MLVPFGLLRSWSICVSVSVLATCCRPNLLLTLPELCLHWPLACHWTMLQPYFSAHLSCCYRPRPDFWLLLCLLSVSDPPASCWPGLSDLAPDPAVVVPVIRPCSSASMLPACCSCVSQCTAAFSSRSPVRHSHHSVLWCSLLLYQGSWARAVREAFFYTLGFTTRYVKLPFCS